MRDANPCATPGGMKRPLSSCPSRSSDIVAPSVGEPLRRSWSTTRAVPLQHVPVVGLVQVVVESDDRALLLVGPVRLDHLAPEGEPRTPVGLDEPATVVAVDVRV